MNGLPDRLLFLDVESRGLHGEAFAAGWILVQGGIETSSGYAGCPMEAAVGGPLDPDGDRWVRENVVPVLPFPGVRDPIAVRDAFWQTWRRAAAEGAWIVVEAGFPVEARFLAECLAEHPGDTALSPYPLLDVSTALAVAGMDPLASHERRPEESPAHHPVADARLSARLLATAQGRIAGRAAG